jgi:hypothetical protein
VGSRYQKIGKLDLSESFLFEPVKKLQDQDRKQIDGSLKGD